MNHWLSCMATSDRNGRTLYVHETVAGFLATCDGPLHLFNDSLDDTFLANLRATPRIILHAKSQEHQARDPYVRRERKALRFMAHFAALECACSHENDGFLLLEDDLIFLNDWVARLERAIAYLATCQGRYTLRGFSVTPNRGRTREYLESHPAVLEDPWNLGGNQCLFIPAPMQGLLLRYVEEMAWGRGRRRQHGWDFDVLVGRFHERHRCTPYRTAYSVVQHIGYQRSWNPRSKDRCPISPTFESAQGFAAKRVTEDFS